MDASLRKLDGNKEAWRDLAATEKLTILKAIKAAFAEEDHAQWAAECLQCQGRAPSEENKALEMIPHTALIVGDVNALIEVYESLAATGAIPSAKRLESSGSQCKMAVFPFNAGDQYGPMKDSTAELWLSTKEPTQGELTYKKSLKGPGAVGVVLGAGNQGFLSVTDMLDLLFVHNEVVMMKHHPIREYNMPRFARVFKVLMDRGFLAQMMGGIKESSALVHHPLVSHVHMTGGKPTHDAIVWGVGPDQATNKAAGTKVLQATMTSELGCITPWLVTPGEWSDAEIEHHVLQLAAGFTSNNSCNCLAPKLLILDPDSPMSAKFMNRLKFHLSHRPLVAPYYPGTAQRYKAFTDHYKGKDGDGCVGVSSFSPASPPDVGAEGKDMGPPLPWCLVELGLDGQGYTAPWEYACTQEAFAPVLAVAYLPSKGEAAKFLANAVSLCNDKVFGTLSCSIFVHPTTEKDVLEKAVAEIRYGAVCINTWSAQAVSAHMASWGAFPGEDLADVQSGIGIVKNYLMYDHVEKSVLRTPFVTSHHIGTEGKPSIAKAHGLVAFLTRPGFGTFVGMIAADVPKAPCMAVLVLGVAAIAYKFFG